MGDSIIPLKIETVPLGEGYVYRWVHIESGKMYIGSHCGNDPKYTASGVGIKRAFALHGMESFRREFLYVGCMYREKETEFLLLVDAANNPRYYNQVNFSDGFPVGVDHSGDKNGFFGKNHTEDTKEIFRQTAKERVGDKNGMFGRSHSPESKRKMAENTDMRGQKNPMFGYQWSVEQREAQRQKITGNIHTPEARQKISEAMEGSSNPFYGRTHTEDVKIRIQAAAKLRDKVDCPHCGKHLDIANAKRWHFEKCKEKK